MQTNDARRWEAIDTFYLPQRAPLIVQTQDALYDAAADHLKRETPITYLEYGVASATSMRAMAARFGAPTSSFIGFDSFEGLPRPWLMHERGAFSTGGVLPYFGDPRVEFVRGWFQNTVPDRLKRLGQPANTTLVHYDCDLYSSTLFLLSTMWHYIPAYYFLMDDFIHEDATALYDFPRSYPVEIQFFAERSGGGGHPNQVFGHIRRVPFVLPD
jgi:hypothetical protein